MDLQGIDKKKELEDMLIGAKQTLKGVEQSIIDLEKSYLLEKDEMKKSYENMKIEINRVIRIIEEQLKTEIF